MKDIINFINESNGLSLNQLINDLIKKYDNAEITGEAFVAALKAEIEKQNNDTEVKLLKGSWVDGTVEYKGTRYKIKYIQDAMWHRGYCLYWKGVNGSPDGNGFFINNSKEDFDDPTLKYVWVDNDGKLHDTKQDWDNATDTNGAGPRMFYVNFQASVAEFIKRWVKLQEI